MDDDAILHSGDENPTVFVLKRELSEVHLLLDNLSTNPTTSLVQKEAARPKQLPDDWLARISRMNWPPSQPSKGLGEDAELLIRTKDYLNTLTSPANGASVAFTLLVTQDDHGVLTSLWRGVRRVWRGMLGGPRKPPPPGPPGSPPPPKAPSRHSLAEIAYPGLIRTAVFFRICIYLFAAFLLAALLLTSYLSWYTAFGNITLAERAAAQTKLDDATKRVSDLEGGGNKADGAAGDAPILPQTGPKPIKVEHLCPEAVSGATYSTVSAMQACEAKTAAQKRVVATDRILIRWLKWWPANDRSENDDIDLVTSTIVTLLGTAVLPVFYGVLGAASAVVRTLSFKIKTSQLTPRDIQVLLQQLLLGTVTGACISLFVAQPSADHSGSPGLMGSVALSASALAFVAGFGVDQVYSSLDSLIRRVFLIDPPKSS
jgi:hypothetical protein